MLVIIYNENHWKIVEFNIISYNNSIAQLVGAVEYTDCTSAEG